MSAPSGGGWCGSLGGQEQSGLATTGSQNALQGGSLRSPKPAFGNEFRDTWMLSEQDHLSLVISLQKKAGNNLSS